jgi:hypothetical protein
MSVNVFLSDDELAAITDFLPRVQVANIVTEGCPLHRALLKIAPSSLPTSLRYAADGWDRSKPRPETCTDGSPVSGCDACACDGYCVERYGGK